MRVLAGLRDGERRLMKRMASWDSAWARRVLPAAEEAAEHTKLWCGAALALGALGGWRGRKAAVAGLAGMAVAETLSNAVVKPLCDRRRPPKEWFEDQDVDDRPDSSSFPSGHTAAAVGFTAAIAPIWPWAGAVCAVPTVTVAAERVHSGAHYPSDVVTGVVIGLAAAGLVRAAPRLLLRHLR
ncbi:phosphatase PAP2 family protein [Streptomyces sp. ISL-86]|uniref:phosphatase PAP2 family protein n=1 Tax=Streptomyces sp. ISL-86 TaxID=2819187 RepID=UPI002035D93D|nr:phosphatase PAP2 family protein [Streptomyces sp. ISL-86]